MKEKLTAVSTSAWIAAMLLGALPALAGEPGIAGWPVTGGFLGTLDARLIALDLATGKRCSGFGNGGDVDLLQGIENVVDPWEYNVTSPPTVVGDVVVVGSSIADIIRRIQPSGAVRGF